MYSEFKIVCCTAAGRMRYMQYIFPYVLASDIVDRYDIWVNTTNMQDIECFKLMAERYPKIRLVWQPDGICDGINSINAFYRYCIEDDTIYIKIDDDIVWMEPDTFEKMVKFRIEHREAFLVTPQVVNNPMGSYLWQVKGILNYGKYMPAFPNHRILWKRGAFAEELHHYFLSMMERNTESIRKLYFGAVPVASNRFSINFVMWFGSGMAKINGQVPGDDEEYLSSVVASKLGILNYYNGDCIVAHFAFGPQRFVLDKSDVLERYGRLCEEFFKKNEDMQKVWQAIKEMKKNVELCLPEVMAQQPPYPIMKKPFMKRMKTEFKAWQKKIAYRIEKAKGVKYIVKEGSVF
jgi:hypothetical protein